jgi:hypothetical protein
MTPLYALKGGVKGRKTHPARRKKRRFYRMASADGSRASIS